MYTGILSTIGNTPLIKLERVFGFPDINIFAKLESFNPCGSIKDRTAANMIYNALKTGKITRDTVVIESSSGNLGIGLAQACAFYGLRFICVIDPKTAQHVIAMLKAFRAEVVVVADPEPNTGEFLPARIEEVNRLLSSIPSSFWINQYCNPDNPAAHYKTMAEIANALNSKIDYLFCATSTCGTLSGCSEYARSNNLKTRIVAVDAVGSVIFGGKRSIRKITGHGASLVPGLYKAGLEDEYVLVSDYDCIKGCRRLLATEAILAGGSSGGVITAVERKLPEMETGSNCVVLLADSGDRYLDTIFSDDWVTEHFGAIL
jgi:N-(2-amino-2-carboxyethyl)-L-glutamate synthase